MGKKVNEPKDSQNIKKDVNIKESVVEYINKNHKENAKISKKSFIISIISVLLILIFGGWWIWIISEFEY